MDIDPITVGIDFKQVIESGSGFRPLASGHSESASPRYIYLSLIRIADAIWQILMDVPMKYHLDVRFHELF